MIIVLRNNLFGHFIMCCRFNKLHNEKKYSHNSCSEFDRNNSFLTEVGTTIVVNE